jgi:DNA mismatch repair ATPase MutL
MGLKLTMNGSSGSRSFEKVACEVGTLIRIKKLFHNIPVRQKEFQTYYKNHYNRFINSATEYALIAT